MRSYTVEKYTKWREMYTFVELNEKGEKVQVELTYCYPDNSSSNSLPVLWKKNGFTDKLYDSYIAVNTYVTTPEGSCYGWYNPYTKLSEDGHRRVINFDNLFEVSEANKLKLLEMVEKLAFKGASI